MPDVLPTTWTPLSRQQARMLRTIARMAEHGDVAHDLEGDLSLCSANMPATVISLQRRGLIDGHYEPMAMEGEEWTYTLTDAGREAVQGAL